MKRVLLGLLCLLVLAFWGCTSVNQTNRFAVMPEAEATAAPVETATPEATAAPVVTPPPAVQLDLGPTDSQPPVMTDTPAPVPDVTVTPAPTETPTREPDSGPGGFNG